MANDWARDAFFYHVYPLGLCGAPFHNDFASEPQPGLAQFHGWIDHLRWLGVTAVYFGPLFESTSHGYDTADYYHVDRRLGTDDTLAELVADLHRHGIRVVLDGVFNHVGRDFWAFRDLLAHGEGSAYRDWFAGVRFGAHSPFGDPFAYEGWNGHYSLVKLNLSHAEVREHLLLAVRSWMERYDVDGLRLDVADSVQIDFLRTLARYARELRPDFWLMGEVIHGDYRRWANPETLDSATNYECYKGLYSAHNARNYFEIRASLDRQSGPHGLYRDLALYNFADNHDVDRVASTLREPAHLYPLYALLFTMPGIPSVYYGSEWGWLGRKAGGDDRPLRPALTVAEAAAAAPHRDLARAIAHFARVRAGSLALRRGGYKELAVGPEAIAFARQAEGESVVVAINAAPTEVVLRLTVPGGGQRLRDLLNEGTEYPIEGGHAVVAVPSRWARVLRVE